MLLSATLSLCKTSIAKILRPLGPGGILRVSLNSAFTMNPRVKEPVYYVLKRRIPCTQEWLGRIVQYYQDPTACYTPARALEATDLSDVLIIEESDFRINVNASRDEIFKSRLSRLLGFENSATREEKMDFESPSINKRSLTNYKKAFERLKFDCEVRKDLPDMLPVGGKAYMIVGVVEIENASVKHTKAASSSVDTGATIPIVDVALAAASIPITLGGVGDFQLERQTGQTSSVETKSKTSQREIIAIEYRMIQRSLLGFGRRAVYRDSIPKYQSGLTFQGDDEEEDTDLEDAEDSMSDIDLREDLPSPATMASFTGKELAYDPSTGFWSHF